MTEAEKSRLDEYTAKFNAAFPDFVMSGAVASDTYGAPTDLIRIDVVDGGKYSREKFWAHVDFSAEILLCQPGWDECLDRVIRPTLNGLVSYWFGRVNSMKVGDAMRAADADVSAMLGDARASAPA